MRTVLEPKPRKYLAAGQLTDEQLAKQRLNHQLNKSAAYRAKGQFILAHEVLTKVAIDPEVSALGPVTSLGLPRRLQSAFLKLAKAEGNLINRIGYQFHLVPPPECFAKYGRFNTADRLKITIANKNTIPRVIHQIWIGSQPAPITTLSWANHARTQGFDYKLWREEDLMQLGLGKNAAFQGMIAKGDLPGAVDIARYVILERHGGIYLDCDWFPARSDISFDTYWPMTGLSVIAENIPRNTSKGGLLLANSAIATPPNHPVFTRLNTVIAEVIQEIPNGPAWWVTGPLIFSELCRGGSVALAAPDILAKPIAKGASMDEVEQYCIENQTNDGGLLLAWKPWEQRSN